MYLAWSLLAPCLVLLGTARGFMLEDKAGLDQEHSREAVKLVPDASLSHPDFETLQEDSFSKARSLFWTAAMQTWVLVAGAEIFDKSFFIAMVLAMKHKHNWLSVITGGVLALSLHAVVCVALGSAAAKVVSRHTLSAIAAGIFLTFAAICAWEYVHADADASSEELEEAARQVGSEADDGKDQSTTWRASLTVFWTAFGLSMLGEFGDRTQLAMISQAAIHDKMAVLVGSITAFVFVETVAVTAGLYCGRGVGVSVRTVALLGGCCFGLFGIIALFNFFNYGPKASALAALLSLN